VEARISDIMFLSVLQDINKLQKRIPFECQAVLGKSMMLAKWRNEYKEARLADSFSAAWYGLSWTLAELSADWYGGVSPTNNPLENLNKHLKVAPFLALILALILNP